MVYGAHALVKTFTEATKMVEYIMYVCVIAHGWRWVCMFIFNSSKKEKLLLATVDLIK